MGWEGGIRKEGGEKEKWKKMNSHCGQLCVLFQSEADTAEEEEGEREWGGKKVKLKAPSSCLPSSILVGSGHSQPLKDLFQREGIGWERNLALQFSILFNPDTNLANKPNPWNLISAGHLD